MKMLAWCQKPIWSCTWQSWIFFNYFFFAQNGSKIRLFEFMECILLVISLHESHIWEKSDSWDMGQSALGQSDYIYLDDEIAWFFACWCKFMDIKCCWKILGCMWSKMDVATLWSKMGVATLVTGLWLHLKKKLLE